MALITNTTLVKVKDEMAIRNQRLASIANLFDVTPWEMVSLDVKSGNASKYAIGSELLGCKYTYEGLQYDFPWIVVDNDRECTWPDGSVHPGLWLAAKYLVPNLCAFDEPEGLEATEETAAEGMYYVGVSGTTYTALNLSTGDTIPYSSYTKVLKGAIRHKQVYVDGYNRYKDSVLRQWLNSDADPSEWWEPAHVGDNEPSYYNKAGFMKYLSEEFVAVINPVKIQTAANTSIDSGVTDITYDRFFAPSLEEIYGVAQVSNVEGPYFPYFKTVMGVNSPTNDANSGRILYKLNSKTTASNPHLRSASKNTAYNVWSDNTEGACSNNVARHTRNPWAFCVIS